MAICIYLYVLIGIIYDLVRAFSATKGKDKKIH